VVDDSIDMLRNVSAMLSAEGFHTIMAATALDAMKIYKMQFLRVDVVLLDYKLPIFTGAEVFEELRAINPQVKVLLTSGIAEIAEMRKMLQRGLLGFIPKPFTCDALCTRLREAMRATRSPVAQHPAV